MIVIVDRFEGEFAVVELPDKTMVNMPVVLLPEGTQEGDLVEISVNQEATKQKAEKITRLMDEVWE